MRYTEQVTERAQHARDHLKNAVGITNKEAKARTERLSQDTADVAGQGRGKAEQALGDATDTIKNLPGKTG